MPGTQGMTARQSRFVVEYLVDRNGTQAAIRAGYSPIGAEVTASKLLRVPKVAEAIAQSTMAQADRLAARTGITQERVLAELEMLAFSDIDHYEIDDAGNVHLADGAPPMAKRAISSIKRKSWSDGSGGHTVEVELKFWDKPGQVKLAGRHVGLFPDRVEVTGKGGKDLLPATREDALAALLRAVPKPKG